MKIDGALNVWGKGQLIAYSGIDGETDYDDGLVLRSREEGGFDLCLPEPGRILLPGGAPRRCFLASDCFELDGIRGVLPECRHLLIEGDGCSADVPAGKLTVLRRGNRLLVGVAAHFRPELIDADIDALLAERKRYFETLPDFGVTDPLRLRTLAKAYSQLKGQVNSACGGIPCRWTTPDRWPHRRMWLWDSVFHAVGLRHFDPETARESLRAVLSQQLPDGLIPHMMSPHGHSEVTQPPVLAFGIAAVDETAPDRVFLAEAFPKLERYLDWIFRNRDSDGAGLVEWAIEGDPHCRSGESGMDNSPRFDSAAELDAPDFNSYLSLECETMAAFARKLELPERAAFWQERHERLNGLMNRLLWSEGEGIYMDRDVRGGGLTGVAASAGFLPLICGAPSEEQAAKLLANLRDPERFGTPFRIPSISRRNAEAYAKDMWRGPVWININYLIGLGLERYGFKDEAEKLFADTVREEERMYARYGTFFEFYDDRRECDPPELLRKGKCAPGESPYHQVFFDYGWSATLYIEMVRRLAGR